MQYYKLIVKIASHLRLSVLNSVYLYKAFMNRLLIQVLLLSIFSVSAQKQSLPNYKVSVFDPTFKAYYFFSPLKISARGNSLPINMIVDSKGDLIYYNWMTKGPFAGNFRLHPNGLMSYHFDGKFYLMDKTFKLVDTVGTKNGIQLDPHEFIILPNGHYILIGSEYITMDLSVYPYFNKKQDPGSKQAKVKCDVIQELDDKKNMVFEWHGKDHFDFTDVDPVYFSDPVNVDWMHFNAVEDDGEGNLFLSSKHLNEITKIRKSDGKILWRLGGKRNQFTFTDDVLTFKGQHDVRVSGRNRITLFDNGSEGFPLHPETAKEYLIDEKNHTVTLIWSYVNNPEAWSSGYGNVQKLSENTMLVNYGKSDKNFVLFNVIGPQKKKLFELTGIDSLINYRAFAYTDLPWVLKRPTIRSSVKNGSLFLEAEQGYKDYNWSDGQKGHTICVKQPGIYKVVVELPQGGYVTSSQFLVKSLTNLSANKIVK